MQRDRTGRWRGAEEQKEKEAPLSGESKGGAGPLVLGGGVSPPLGSSGAGAGRPGAAPTPPAAPGATPCLWSLWSHGPASSSDT